MSFDFIKFVNDSIRSIDEIRASGASPQNLNNNSAEKIESRINAFYRAIGLPAFVSENIELDQHNNGNLFETLLDDNTRLQLLNRELNFKSKIPENDIKKLLDYNDFKITDSIPLPNNGGPLLAKRTRGSLFPMRVFGNISIYPQSSRVGGAFWPDDKDLTQNDIIYKRPLIEFIALLRLRNEGVDDSTIRDAVRQDFSSELFELVSGTNFNLLTSNILSNLLKSFDDLPGFIRDAVKNINSIRSKIRNTLESSNIPAEQPILLNGDQNGALEKLKNKQSLRISKNNALLALVEFDDSITSGKQITKNMKNSILSSSVIDMLQYDLTEINSEISEVAETEKKLLQLLKGYQSQIDMILGIYSGLSGIDILIVITALFSIDKADLLGLLNQKSLDRLSSLKNKTDVGTVNNVNDSIKSLESKVTELFSYLDTKTRIGKVIDTLKRT